MGIVRQSYESLKQVRDHFSDIAFAEENFITFLLRSNLTETSVTNIDKYIEAFCKAYGGGQCRIDKIIMNDGS